MLTVSPGRLQRGRVSDGSRPPLSLLEVGERVLDQRDPKALLHSLPGHPGAHPAPLERVEIGGEVGADVRAVRPSVRPAADTVRQVKNHLRPVGWRRDPLDGQGALRQAHRVPDPVVERVAELPVKHAQDPVPLAGWVRFRGVFLHPGRREYDASRRPVCGWRCGADCDPESLLWDPVSEAAAASPSPESLPSDWKGEWQWWRWRRAQPSVLPPPAPRETLPTLREVRRTQPAPAASTCVFHTCDCIWLSSYKTRDVRRSYDRDPLQEPVQFVSDSAQSKQMMTVRNINTTNN